MRIGLFLMGSLDAGYGDLVGQAVRAEELGYDAVVMAERHFRHSRLLLPSPFVFGAAVGAATTGIRIGVAGRVLPLDHPLRIAEDAATLDVLSDGRLDFGVARASLDEEAHAVFGSPIAESAGRFEEALEIIVAAWTQGRFSFEGQHYSFPEISVLPKPVQQPHPPVGVVAVSPGRLEFAARRGYSAIVSALGTVSDLEQAAATYRAELTGDRGEFVVNRFVYVAESDEKARREFEEPFLRFLDSYAPDLRAALTARYGGRDAFKLDRFERDFLLVGSPDTVRARLAEVIDRAQPDMLLFTTNFLTLDQARCVRSMELLAAEVGASATR